MELMYPIIIVICLIISVAIYILDDSINICFIDYAIIF